MSIHLKPIGFIHSPIKERCDAPKQGSEGAPAAQLAVDPAYAAALDGLKPGQKVVLITWLHQGVRDVLRVHPRGDLNRPMRGVFTTRSPDRPNPLGLHEVTVTAVDGLALTVEPLEAIDGTPVVDIKSAG